MDPIEVAFEGLRLIGYLALAGVAGFIAAALVMLVRGVMEFRESQRWKSRKG